MNEDTDSESSLLVVIFDTSLTQDVILNDEIKLSECLEIIITFVNAHLMLKSNNKIAMITCDSRSCAFIYPDEEQEPGQLRQTDGQYELFTHNVTIDVCSLQKEITLLQQACDITNGVFLKLPQLSSLLQYLLWVFLPDPTVRKKLVVPPPVSVDYRPFCFCHHELIDIGFVCSVCLAIYCKLSPICTTCEVVFKLKAPMKAVKVKKKKMIKS
ncbi:hypothetical protein M8J76_011682 [Diaphorina citri]|nr:hypothetical protein M8J76_011682 [Diaphorina citri]